MIKKAKKSVAVGLSVALAVTSVNIPVNSASAAAKKAKLNVTKKTITAGKSATLTLRRTNRGTAIQSINVKNVTVTSSKKAVATVKKVSKNSKVTGIKVTAKKAGTSVITVKVTKGTYKGTYKCTVTVKAKATATTAPTTAPTQEPTAVPTTAPTQEPTAAPATTPAITQAPLVQDVAKVDAIVTNSVKGYDNTVLAGQDATIQVLVSDKQGNPVANDNVVLRFDRDTAQAGKYETKSAVVATTNSKGIATFVVGPTTSKVDNTDSTYLGSYKFKVTEASENIVAEGKLDVATISYASSDKYVKHWWEGREADVLNLNGNADYADLVPATNSSKAQTANGYASDIANIAKGKSQYVGTQQVSATGEDHKVAFKTAVYLNIPSETKAEDKVTSYVQKVGQKSGSYETYAEKSLPITYDIKDMNNVEYATLAFNSVNVSKYTKLEVRKAKNVNGVLTAIDGNDGLLETYGSDATPFKQSNFGLQIAKKDLEGSDGIVLQITSKGQVNADNNEGFDVKDLTYVYNKQSATVGEKVLLKNTSIKWETVTPVYSKEEALTEDEMKVIFGTKDLKSVGFASATKTVPVFPYVGNAIIKCYDASGVVQRYYACATKNDTDITGAYKNVNVLDTSEVNKDGITTNAYIISEDEATKSVGTITDKGDGTVEVDSTQTGTTYLVGTISCDDENVSIDAKNEKVYTSVMWNPIAQKTATVQKDNFAAVEGQTVTLTAQLVDKNNNPVSVANNAIEWTGITKTGVTNITTDEKTDTKGQAVAKVSATDALALTDISAKDPSGKYNVVLVLGDKKVSVANLYWVKLGLKYTPSVTSTTSTSTFDDANGTASVSASNVTVGETWKYAAQIDAKVVGYDSNYDVKEVTGINFNVAKANSSSVGTVTIKDSVATVASNANGTGAIVNTLNSSTSTNGATLTLVNRYNASQVDTLAFVGTGAPNIDEELTINYTYGTTTAYSASFVTPLSNNAVASGSAISTDKTVYVKVVDGKGNAKEGVTVTFKKTKADGTVTPDTATTDKYGIASTTVEADTAGNSTTVTAKVGDQREIDTIVNWRKVVDFKATAMKYDASAKTVTLTFNSDVYADSVIAKEFEVVYKATADATTSKTYDVSVSSVSGKEVVLALPSSSSIDWARESLLEVKVKDVSKDDSGNGLAYSVAASRTGETIANGTVYSVTGTGAFSAN